MPQQTPKHLTVVAASLAESQVALWTRTYGEGQPTSQTVYGGDSGGPHMPDMELLTARVDALEKGFERVNGKLDSIDIRLRALEGDIREIKGTLNTLTNSVVGKLPTWWQMPAVMAGLLALVGIAIKAGILHP